METFPFTAPRIVHTPQHIERIETIPLRVPLRKTFRGSSYYMTHRCTVVTRVYTSGGIVGECYNGDEDDTQKGIVDIIQHEIAPLLLGKDALAIEACWETARKPASNILRERKLAMEALALVDCALWDVLGKVTGLPLFRLWGGSRSRLPVICIAGYYVEGKTNADLCAEMESIASDGFAGCKMKVGGLTPEQDFERVRLARKHMGDDFVLIVDANQAWSTRDAIRFAQLAEQLNITWFEEPCRWYDDRRGMALVRSAGRIPVCAGQSEIAANGCRDLMMDGAIDYCNFDASWGGGATEWRRVASLAHAFDVKMAHHEEPQVASHLLASVAHSSFLEWFHPDRDPLYYELVANRPRLEGGHVSVPEGPGWGLELDRATIERYRIDK